MLEDLLLEWRNLRALRPRYAIDRRNVARAYWFARHHYEAAYLVYRLGREDEQRDHYCY